MQPPPWRRNFRAGLLLLARATPSPQLLIFVKIGVCPASWRSKGYPELQGLQELDLGAPKDKYKGWMAKYLAQRNLEVPNLNLSSVI